MRRIMSILVALLVVGMVPGAVAQQQQLTPVPVDQQDQQPEATAPPAVLVLPFTMLGDDGKHDWVGQGIQQNLQAELGRAGLELVGTLQIKPMNRVPVLVRPEDEVVAALKMGAEAKADVVIFGNYQVVDDELRVTGRVMDVASGQNVGFLKANGTLRNLLALEDELANQTLRFFQAVPEGEAVQQQAAVEPAVAEPLVQQQEPLIFEAGADTVYSPRYYDDDIDSYDWIGAATYVYPTYYPVEYYYPSYSYYYKPYCYRPWYWSSFSFGFHYDRHHRHHHHHYGYHRDYHRHSSLIDRHRWDRHDRYRPGRHDDRDDRFRRGGDSVRGRTTIVALNNRDDDHRRLTSVGYRSSSDRHAQYVSGARRDNASSSSSASSLSRLRTARSTPTLAYRGDRYRKDSGKTTVKRDPVKVVSPPSARKDARDVAVVKKDDKPAASSDDSKKVVRVTRDPFSSRESRTTRQPAREPAREPARDVKRETPREAPRREAVREPVREPSRTAQRDPSPSRATERAPSRSSSSASSSRSSASSRRESAPVRSSSSSSLRSSSSGRSVASISSRGSDARSRSSSIRSSSSGSRASGSSFRSSSSSSRSSGSSSSSRSSGGGGGSSRGGGGSRGR